MKKSSVSSSFPFFFRIQKTVFLQDLRQDVFTPAVFRQELPFEITAEIVVLVFPFVVITVKDGRIDHLSSGRRDQKILDSRILQTLAQSADGVVVDSHIVIAVRSSLPDR